MSLCGVFVVVVAMGIVVTARADTSGLPELASSAFTYKYEMTAMPTTENFDGNATLDWTVGGSGTNPTVSDGIMTMPGDGTFLISGQGSGGVWSTNFPSGGDYTIEFSAKILSSTGTYGALQLYAGSTVARIVDVGVSDTKVRWCQNSGGDLATELDNKSAFHAYRVAYAADNKFYVWRDGVLIGDALVTGHDYPYLDLYIGDGGGNFEGVSQIDYFRVTSGAYAPVPEPSSVVLLGSAFVGLLAFAWRKWK
jgi:hypothetical protein